jgi:hypothetical protein
MLLLLLLLLHTLPQSRIMLLPIPLCAVEYPDDGHNLAVELELL